MTVFQLDVQNQKLSLSKYAKQIITTNSVNFFECLLNFDGVWNNTQRPEEKKWKVGHAGPRAEKINPIKQDYRIHSKGNVLRIKGWKLLFSKFEDGSCFINTCLN